MRGTNNCARQISKSTVTSVTHFSSFTSYCSCCSVSTNTIRVSSKFLGDCKKRWEGAEEAKKGRSRKRRENEEDREKGGGGERSKGGWDYNAHLYCSMYIYMYIYRYSVCIVEVPSKPFRRQKKRGGIYGWGHFNGTLPYMYLYHQTCLI